MSALPQPAEVVELRPEPEFSLRSVIRECLDEIEVPDREVLIDLILKTVDPSLYEVALRQALPDYIGVVRREGRRSKGRGELGSDRWSDVAAQHGSGALAIYRWWITLDPDQPPKFFGDCTRPEVEQVVASYKKQALAMADQAQRFAAVAKAMKERGAETVQDVPVERLVEIFNA